MFLRSSLLLVIIFGMILTPHLTAQESKKTEGQKQQSVKKSDPPKKTKTKPAPKAKKTGDKKPAPKALELKDLFPEKSMFGPSASRMAFFNRRAIRGLPLSSLRKKTSWLRFMAL